MGGRLTGLIGMALLIAIAVALSSDRRAIRLRVVAPAFAAQAGIAVAVLYLPWGRAAIEWLAGGVADLLGYAKAGTDFVLGPLASPAIGGTSFAIAALPTIIFFASLVGILYHLGVMPRLVRWVGGAIERAIGLSRVESLCAAANIFVGQSESPLVIRPYLAGLSPSRLFQVMVSGMAGVAGTILAAYAAMGIRIDYLLAASAMAAPGGILMAKLMMPDPPGAPPAPGESGAIARVELVFGEERPANLIMAAAEGAQLGLRLAAAVGAMVLAFVALVALANGLLAGIGHWCGVEGLSFQHLLGLIFAPVMALVGVPWREAGTAGALFGEKLVLNEFVAYAHFAPVATTMSARAQAIIIFALCGFANFGSIAIQLAVTGGLAPGQRPTIARLGIRALIAGSLANLMSAALAGMLVG